MVRRLPPQAETRNVSRSLEGSIPRNSLAAETVFVSLFPCLYRRQSLTRWLGSSVTRWSQCRNNKRSGQFAVLLTLGFRRCHPSAIGHVEKVPFSSLRVRFRRTWQSQLLNDNEIATSSAKGGLLAMTLSMFFNRPLLIGAEPQWVPPISCYSAFALFSSWFQVFIEKPHLLTIFLDDVNPLGGAMAFVRKD